MVKTEGEEKEMSDGNAKSKKKKKLFFYVIILWFASGSNYLRVTVVGWVTFLMRKRTVKLIIWKRKIVNY